ncbi:hypothetical protein D6810_00725 [Candidatus Dojkabacteria bacterium]|uniref:Uncharacterized protein n=1 Tax=Candidatus Dojkabacteria bacterium TaxID=2099670 RepID=A0A3M0Z0F5_9BACT|nr:MAG: hypothetical protein D6810_00725 [Candidatus Dojkabacteria bacterium]
MEQNFGFPTPKFCERCGKPYGIDDVTVFPEGLGLPILNVRSECKFCRHVVLLKVVNRGTNGFSGLKQIGRNYSSQQDKEFLVSSEPIGSREVLEFYEILMSSSAQEIIHSLAQINKSKIIE